MKRTSPKSRCIQKALCLLLCALLTVLCACSPSKPETTVTPEPAITPAPEPTEAPTPSATPLSKTSLHFSLEEYPVVDGSTANLPLMAEVLSRIAGISREEAETLTTCTTTPYAYEALLDGRADLLLVYEPAQETWDIINSSDTELTFVPIGRDALVFIANESNPVSGLTQEQLTGIYTGKITNWQEVGGEDLEIVPFQRSSNSGSQALFIKLLMKETSPMGGPTELFPTEMGELIERLAEYNNAGSALGYSVFYYASYMYTKPGLKFLSVDGVFPSDETIADASYPLLNEYYAVYRSDEPEDSPARQIAQWLTTAEGAACIRDAGYIPVS